MKRNKVIHSLIFLFLSCLFPLPLFGQPAVVSEYFRQIDKAFYSKDINAVDSILKSCNGTESYPYVEAYTLKRTRLMIIEDNLEFARQASLVVIDNNLENFDAIDLYSYIDKALLNQEAQRKAAENRKLLEAERAAAVKARSKQQIEKRDNYQNVNTASGTSIYINERQQSFSAFQWILKLGIADILYQHESSESYNSVKYGLSGGGDFYYPSERFILGCNFEANAHVLTMGVGEQEFLVNGKIVPEIALSDFSKNFFLRLGFSCHSLFSSADDSENPVEAALAMQSGRPELMMNKKKSKTNSFKTFATPVVGVALDNFYIGSSRLFLYADYDFGHFAYSDLNAATEFGGTFMIPLAEGDRTRVGVVLGAHDLLLIKSSGVENRVNFTFAIGVGNVVK